VPNAKNILAGMQRKGKGYRDFKCGQFSQQGVMQSYKNIDKRLNPLNPNWLVSYVIGARNHFDNRSKSPLVPPVIQEACLLPSLAL